jgi:hypothetical protein
MGIAEPSATSTVSAAAGWSPVDLFTDDPERRAWHLAEAVIGPDEPAAGLLTADRALHKGTRSAPSAPCCAPQTSAPTVWTGPADWP